MNVIVDDGKEWILAAIGRGSPATRILKYTRNAEPVGAFPWVISLINTAAM